MGTGNTSRPAATALLLALVLALPGTASAADRAVARVGPEAITGREVDLLLAREKGLLREQALRLLAERRLALLWARKHSLSVSDQETDAALVDIRKRTNLSEEDFAAALRSQGLEMDAYRREIRDSLLASRATAAATAERVTVNDREVEEFYRRDFRPREVITLSQIFFALPEGASADSTAAVLRRVEAAASDIRGGLPFAEAASRWSEDPTSSSRGGDLGTFNPGDLLPELERAAAGLSVGGLSGPVRSPQGVHLLMVRKREVIPPPHLAAVRAEVEAGIRREKGEKAYRDWMGELEKEYLFEIFPSDGK